VLGLVLPVGLVRPRLTLRTVWVLARPRCSPARGRFVDVSGEHSSERWWRAAAAIRAAKVTINVPRGSRGVLCAASAWTSATGRPVGALKMHLVT